jgi:hypothetical protein
LWVNCAAALPVTQLNQKSCCESTVQHHCQLHNKSDKLLWVIVSYIQIVMHKGRMATFIWFQTSLSATYRAIDILQAKK